MSKKGKVFEKHQLIPQQHEKLLLIWLEELFQQADLSCNELDVICYSCGPGAFTGIRIGASIAQGLALPNDLTVLAIPSLQVLAQGVYRERGEQKIIVIQDARIEQIYCGYYQLDSESLMQPIVADRICKLDEVDYSILQDAAVISNLSEEVFWPSAKDVLFIGKNLFDSGMRTKAFDALPMYLRSADAWRKIS
jgi:tRNA threonylcarbamoyladenosine biosynthesis protein TsaB